MIDWKKSAKLNNSTIVELKAYLERYPKSDKKVWRVCNGGCDTGNCWICYSKSHRLCNSCERVKRYKDSKAREKQSKSAMGHEVTQQTRKKISRAAIKQFEDPEQRKKASELKKGKMVGKGNPFYGKKHSKNTRKKMHESQEKRCENPEECKRRSARAQGIPYDEWEFFATKKRYCPKFNESCRESNREKYNRKCFICGIHESENITSDGKIPKLSVHHVDRNKAQGCDGHNWSLIPLCVHCHSMVHTNVWVARLAWLLNHAQSSSVPCAISGKGL